MLNSDYKIFAKVLAVRLKMMLPQLIDQDQTGFMQNRYIGSNIRRTLDIINITDLENIPGMIISVDMEKAFDTLEWSAIHRSFQYFNISEQFFNWVMIALRDMKCCTVNNGWNSQLF